MQVILLCCGLYWLALLFPLSLLLCGPCWWLGRRRVNWQLLDYSVCVLPYWFWAALYVHAYSAGTGKQLGNMFVEGLVLTLLTPVVPLLRLLLASRTKAVQTATALAGALLLATVGFTLWATVPPTGEK